MTRCAKCRKLGHNSSAHRQFCAICGGSEKIMPNVEDVNPSFRCDDVKRHAEIRAAFGDTAFITEGRTSMAAKRKDKNQLRLV